MTNTCTLNFKKFGEGKPLIILHGLFGTLDNWQTIAKKIAENFEVFLVDQRNHGRSPHSQEMSYELMATDLRQFIIDHNIQNPHIVGHSMGGKAVMKFLDLYPDLCDKSIVIDIAPKKYSGGHEDLIAAMQSLPIDEMKSRGQAAKFLAEKIPNEGVLLFLLKNLTRNKEGKYEWKMNLPVLAENYQKLMDSEITKVNNKEVLFIKGGASQYILDNDVSTIKTLYPFAQIITVEGAGHWVHASHPQQVIDAFVSYLQP